MSMDLTPIRPIIGISKEHEFEMDLLRQRMSEVAKNGPTKNGDVVCPWRKGFFGRLFCMHYWRKGSQTSHNPLIFGRCYEWHCMHCGKSKTYRDGDGPISYLPTSYYTSIR